MTKPVPPIRALTGKHAREIESFIRKSFLAAGIEKSQDDINELLNAEIDDVVTAAVKDRLVRLVAPHIHRNSDDGDGWLSEEEGEG